MECCKAEKSKIYAKFFATLLRFDRGVAGVLGVLQIRPARAKPSGNSAASQSTLYKPRATPVRARLTLLAREPKSRESRAKCVR
jgi:hypothetical protein